jgi:protein-disulfide isomerase
MSQSPAADPALTPDKAIDHILGPASAGVTLIEYGDLECPSCRQAQSMVQHLRDKHVNAVRFVFRHYPLINVHSHAELAAEAAEAAGAQGKFWPYVDLLFEHQSHLEGKHLQAYAEQLELDMDRFRNEMSDHVYLQRVQEHIALGDHLHVRATPTFYVNRVLVDVSYGLQNLEKAVTQALAASPASR